jgi:hypothetical protein
MNAYFAQIDVELFSAVTDRNLMITGGGIIGLDTSTNVLSWTAPIQLTNFVTGFFEEIPAGAVTLLPGQFLCAIQVRGLEDIVGPINLVAFTGTKLVDRPRGELHVDTVLCFRYGDLVIWRNGAILPPDFPFPILITPTVTLRRAFVLSEFLKAQWLNQSLMGTPDSVRTVFGICRNIDDNLFAIYIDGLRMTPGIDFDILANHRIRFTPAPAPLSRFVLDLYEPAVVFESVFEEANIWAENPEGAIDGINAVFTLCLGAVTGTLRVYLDGMRMKLGTDYTVLNATQFQFSVAPAIGSVVLVDYIVNRSQVNEFTAYFTFNELPTNINPTQWQTAANYRPVTTQLYLDGMRMKLGVDYIETAPNKVTFSTPPVLGSVVLIDYMPVI